MKKNLLTDKELEWLDDNHSNIKPYLTSMIRNIEWQLKYKNPTPADVDRLNKQLLAEKQKRTEYIRNKYIKDADLKAYFAEKAKAAGIESVVFDRNGYLYHGRVQALADAAREGGLKF